MIHYTEVNLALAGVIMCFVSLTIFLLFSNFRCGMLLAILILVIGISILIYESGNISNLTNIENKQLQEHIANETKLIKSLDCKDLKQHIINEDLNYTGLQYQKDQYIWRCGVP